MRHSISELPARQYHDRLLRRLSASVNVERAPAMEAYMRHHFPFWGIEAPRRKLIVKEMIVQEGLLAGQEIPLFLQYCWETPEREMQYAGLDIAERLLPLLSDAHLFCHLILQKSWWDTADWLISKFVGSILLRTASVDERRAFARQQYASKNIWQQRTAILLQLSYKNNTDVELLLECCRACSSSKEFFVQKAIGWALRQYARTAPDVVKEFCSTTKLPTLSRKEALKHIDIKSP
jgi:3-methyladenine DNA glycosylase AlkD